MESHAQIVHNYVCIFYLRNNSSFFKGKKKSKDYGHSCVAFLT